MTPSADGRYLEAATPDAKAACVRDPQRMAPLLNEMAQRHPEFMRPVTDVEVKASGLAHYSDPRVSTPVTPVLAVFKDLFAYSIESTEIRFNVVHAF